MFGALKDKIGGGAIDSAIEKFAPALQEHMDKIKSLQPADVQDDEKFTTMIVKPMLMSISASSGGVTKLIPKFETRFTGAMMHVRDELIIVDGSTVKLAEGSMDKLPKVLLEGFKKSA